MPIRPMKTVMWAAPPIASAARSVAPARAAIMVSTVEGEHRHLADEYRPGQRRDAACAADDAAEPAHAAASSAPRSA